MLQPIFTLDYEIHGNGEGNARELMVAPTARLLELFDRYGAKLTIMADVAEILKFKEHAETTGRDEHHYHAIIDQLRTALRTGHDVQLHIHPAYFNAVYRDDRWQQDWSEYDFAGLPYERMAFMVRTCKRFLEATLREADAAYRCVAFRAANWVATPFPNMYRVLTEAGIVVETSVFRYGRRERPVRFDYGETPSDLAPWRVSAEDVCRADPRGAIFEVPIYAEHRWIGAFLTPMRVRRALMTRRHPIAPIPARVNARPGKDRAREPWCGAVRTFFARHAWKADFNQCNGRQLIRALERARRRHAKGQGVLAFTLIGHSKLFDARNAASLEPFLAHVRNRQAQYRFATLSEIARGLQEQDAKPA